MRSTSCTDDDVHCCMDNIGLADVLPATCTSVRCLAHDLSVAASFDDAAEALTKHDRHVYLLIVVVAICAALAWLRSVTASRPPAWAGCTCGRS